MRKSLSEITNKLPKPPAKTKKGNKSKSTESKGDSEISRRGRSKTPKKGKKKKDGEKAYVPDEPVEIKKN